MCELLYAHHFFVGGKKTTKQNPCVRSPGTSCDAVLSFCVGAELNTDILQEYLLV